MVLRVGDAAGGGIEYSPGVFVADKDHDMAVGKFDGRRGGEGKGATEFLASDAGAIYLATPEASDDLAQHVVVHVVVDSDVVVVLFIDKGVFGDEGC